MNLPQPATMPPKAVSKPRPMSVFARWRPLTDAEAPAGELERTATPSPPSQLLSVSVAQPGPNGKEPPKRWKSAAAFSAVLESGDDNASSYAAVVEPAIPLVLDGGSCSFFAYGHSGSGKTHSIVGYDFDDDSKQLGLCLAASKKLFATLHELNARGEAGELGIGFSLFELRHKSAFDLLNHRAECHIREGPDGKTHIRGQTETLPGGKVRVQPIVQRACWDFASLRQELVEALSLRATGSSSVHEQSSRTHAVLELEVVNRALLEARRAVVERQSELVPVGKRATDVYLEETTRSIVVKPGGGYEKNPDYEIDQARVDAAEADKAEHEARAAEAERAVADIIASSEFACLGGKTIFVDLAGAEYHTDNAGGVSTGGAPKQSPKERQEGRQINTDLLALKEVMRAWSRSQPRIPFRSSPLTMVLREHFAGAGRGGSGSGGGSSSSMIVTVSPARGQYVATLNSLKYANLVGAATA